MKKKITKMVDINKYEQIMFLDDSLIDKILLMMFTNNEDNLRNYRVGYNEISLMNMMFIYLREYNGTNITEDFYNRFNLVEKEYEIEFYIYFIMQYYRLFNYQFTFSPAFFTNLRDLFYSNDIESRYNPDKFKMHYGSAFTDTLSLKEDVNDSLISYVKMYLPDNLEGDLEKALGIYILLCKVLRYSPIYTITEEYLDTNPYFDVTLENNEVVCVQFAIIYKKLLDMYGIAANLDGNIYCHMFVNLSIGNLIIRVDATRYGYYTDQLELSDLTNMKYDMDLTGFHLIESSYMDPNYIDYCQNRLDDTIRNVSTKMGLKHGIKDRLNTYIDKFQQSEFDLTSEVNADELDNRVKELNSFFTFDGNVESTQFFNYLICSLFYDIKDERMENISLYRNIGNKKLQVTKLLVLYDDENIPHYYMFVDGKLVNYLVDDVVDIILRDGWLFKHNTDIDALYLDDEVVKKLMR